MIDSALFVYHDKDAYVLGFDVEEVRIPASMCRFLSLNMMYEFDLDVPAGPDGTVRRYIFFRPSHSSLYFNVPLPLPSLGVSASVVDGNEPLRARFRFTDLALLASSVLDWEELFIDKLLGSGWQRRKEEVKQ